MIFNQVYVRPDVVFRHRFVDRLRMHFQADCDIGKHAFNTTNANAGDA